MLFSCNMKVSRDAPASWMRTTHGLFVWVLAAEVLYYFLMVDHFFCLVMLLH